MKLGLGLIEMPEGSTMGNYLSELEKSLTVIKGKHIEHYEAGTKLYRKPEVKK